jgi:hypothetical protein
MATNDFIGFASNGSANIMSQADYAAAAEQGVGVQPGMASSKLANKIWRQGANMAAALGRITAARGYDALDNGDLNTLQSSVNDAISVGTFNSMFFSQTSGSYSAPRTGVYRITLKGGGGGGGGAQTDHYSTGGAGGEGGTIVFYETLTKNTSYAYTIGAGGAAGANGIGNTGATNGTDGGTSSIIIGANTYSVTGGEGGTRRYSSGSGGRGGRVKTPNNNSIYLIPGARGGNGVASDSGSSYLGTSPIGGGAGVSAQPYPSIYGGGGNGGGPIASNMSNVLEPTAGGDGYILIEYAG